MTARRVALLDHTQGAYSEKLEAALRADGHAVKLLGEHSIGPVEALLRRRGFTPALSHVPLTVLELLRGTFDIAHAFTGPDAAAALAWRRVHGRPVVFTCTETLDRETLADRRLRLRTLEQGIDDTDAAVAASDDARKAVERWFACSLTVIAADDAGAYARLYDAQLQKTGVST
jgi:hypothetical protein